MADATAFVQPSMLTQPVTLSEYETMHGAIDLSQLRPEIMQRVEQRCAQVAELLEGESELWEWSHGPPVGAIGGLAVVRAGVVIRAWRDWRS